MAFSLPPFDESSMDFESSSIWRGRPMRHDKHHKPPFEVHTTAHRTNARSAQPRSTVETVRPLVLFSELRRSVTSAHATGAHLPKHALGSRESKIWIEGVFHTLRSPFDIPPPHGPSTPLFLTTPQDWVEGRCQRMSWCAHLGWGRCELQGSGWCCCALHKVQGAPKAQSTLPGLVSITPLID